MQNFVNFLVYCQNFAYHCMVKISRFQKKYRKWLIFPFSHSFSKDVSITHLHWGKSIKIVKSRRKNDIDYCKYRWKNVSLHKESPHYLVNAVGYYQSPQDELPDMAARLYVASGISLQRVV